MVLDSCLCALRAEKTPSDARFTETFTGMISKKYAEKKFNITADRLNVTV